MNQHSLSETLKQITAAPQALLYLSGTHCGVCHAVKPRVAALAEAHGLAAWEIDLNGQPEAAGQFQVLTIPAVLLFAHGREYHRQARFIRLDELEEAIQKPPFHDTDYAAVFK